jgi:hypothetical protein
MIHTNDLIIHSYETLSNCFSAFHAKGTRWVDQALQFDHKERVVSHIGHTVVFQVERREAERRLYCPGTDFMKPATARVLAGPEKSKT